jgi:hypothetical protein
MPKATKVKFTKPNPAQGDQEWMLVIQTPTGQNIVGFFDSEDEANTEAKTRLHPFCVSYVARIVTQGTNR